LSLAQALHELGKAEQRRFEEGAKQSLDKQSLGRKGQSGTGKSAGSAGSESSPCSNTNSACGVGTSSAVAVKVFEEEADLLRRLLRFEFNAPTSPNKTGSFGVGSQTAKLSNSSGGTGGVGDGQQKQLWRQLLTALYALRSLANKAAPPNRKVHRISSLSPFSPPPPHSLLSLLTLLSSPPPLSSPYSPFLTPPLSSPHSQHSWPAGMP
jgi:hypothetical protein